nr:hypothetical protein [Spirochaetaceae bacterium]
MNEKKKISTTPKKKGDGKAWKRFKRPLSFIIFFAFAIGVFLLGLINYKIPQGQGVLFYSKFSSKNQIDGYEQQILYPDKLHWRWQAVIPEMSQLFVFPAEVHQGDLHWQGSLPSAELFQNHFSLDEDFSYNLHYLVYYKIDENYWIDRVSQGFISVNSDSPDQENLFQFLEQRISAEFLNLLENQDDF